MTWHVLPAIGINDHHESSTCKCDPAVIVLDTGDLMIVHQPFDITGGVQLFNRILKPQIENDGNE